MLSGKRIERSARTPRHHLDPLIIAIAEDGGNLFNGFRQTNDHGQLPVSRQAITFIGAKRSFIINHMFAKGACGRQSFQALNDFTASGKNAMIGFRHMHVLVSPSLIIDSNELECPKKVKPRH